MIRFNSRFSRSPVRKRHGATFVALIVLGLVAAFAAATLIPTIARSRLQSDQVKCANNLKQIGLAIQLYTNDNRGLYPRTIYQRGQTLIPDVSNGGHDSPDPFKRGTTVPANCVPSALFLLLRTEDIVPAVFVCPTTSGVPDSSGADILQRSNFTNIQQNLGYSYANPYPDDAARASGFAMNSRVDPDFAVAADKNPGISAGSNVLGVTRHSPPAEMRMANSLNHNRDGQNVLYADGHVEFQDNPFAGMNGDNIYCRGVGGPGTVLSDLINSPKSQYDSVLLPAESQK